MRAVDLIVKKRNGMTLNEEEIQFLIEGYVKGEIPDYQISAFLMAVYFEGMDGMEVGRLTRAMIDSGSTMDLSDIPGPLVDKHSTGGVGDKVSLILAPVAAACGLHIPMMSGRALGHTGGTLDKLESITGYNTAIDEAAFTSIISKCGYAMVGQSERIVPADRLLYALRDVTATVESIPLITASIMSKKFAAGAESLVLDVKCGTGAFMKSVEDSHRLAESLIDAARVLGRPIVAVITRMSEPLGYMVGNFLEVVESAYCLMGDSAPDHFRYPNDLMTITLRLTAWMLVAGGIAENVEAGELRCREAIRSGSAYERFCCNVSAQGGDPVQLESELAVRRSPIAEQIVSDQDGFVVEVDAFQVGMAGIDLGAGRSRREDDVLNDVGVELHAKVGDRVSSGDAICTIYADTQSAADAAVVRLQDAFVVGSSAPQRSLLILDELTAL